MSRQGKTFEPTITYAIVFFANRIEQVFNVFLAYVTFAGFVLAVVAGAFVSVVVLVADDEAVVVSFANVPVPNSTSPLLGTKNQNGVGSS